MATGAAPSSSSAALAEVEEVLSRLALQPGVIGTLVATADGAPIRSTLDPAAAAEHGALFAQLAARARSAVRELDPSDEITFLRVRTRRVEIIVSPSFEQGRQYLLLVVRGHGTE